MRYYSIYITLCFILFASCSKDDDTVVIPTDRTIVVYMAANNDLSDDAWDNINKMQSGYEEKGANLIVFIDTADDTPHILRIGRGSSTRVKTYPEFNSADEVKMREVLNDIIELYPAASYGLVLWSHGTSWLQAGSRLKSFGEDHGRQMNIAALAITFNRTLVQRLFNNETQETPDVPENDDRTRDAQNNDTQQGDTPRGVALPP